ncbi:MAG: dTMP kinase [Clostridia bacterium]|nr:dTMP kinase [Clostridia bacterium]
MSKFIVFEGIDGSGKTTQIQLLHKALTERNIPVHITKEPTDDPMGKQLRKYLGGKEKTDLRAIAALFAADRLHHITAENGILDNLAKGRTVLCDRYYLSSYAYQSVDCDLDWIMALNREAASIARPDLHIFLDVPPEQSMQRVENRGETEEIFEKLDRQQQIRKNFFDLFEMLKDKENILIVDGTRTPETIAEEIFNKVKEIL